MPGRICRRPIVHTPMEACLRLAAIAACARLTVAQRSCLQTAPNGYTCLDNEWSPELAGIAGALMVLGIIIYIRLHAKRWSNLIGIVDTADLLDHRVKDLPVKTDARLDVPDEKQKSGHDYRKITAAEIYLSTFDDFELHWVSLLVWLKWRWAFDGLRILGEALIALKIADIYGFTRWGIAGVDMPWWCAFAPLFVLDFVVVVVIYQARSFPLYFGENTLVKVYACLGGFPFGTIFKILICIRFDGGYCFPLSGFFVPVTCAVSLGLIYLLYCSWAYVRFATESFFDTKNTSMEPHEISQGQRQIAELNDRLKVLQIPISLFLTALLLYAAWTYIGFVRIAWPSEARRHMNSDDYNYHANSIWILSPDGNWAEAVTCWWMLLGLMVAVSWSDWFVTLLPDGAYTKDPFEGIQKIISMITITGTATTAVMVLYHIDTEWTDLNRPPFPWYALLPIVVTEIMALVSLTGISGYAFYHCPEFVRNRHEMVKGVKREYRDGDSPMEYTDDKSQNGEQPPRPEVGVARQGSRYFPTGHDSPPNRYHSRQSTRYDDNGYDGNGGGNINDVGFESVRADGLFDHRDANGSVNGTAVPHPRPDVHRRSGAHDHPFYRDTRHANSPQSAHNTSMAPIRNQMANTYPELTPDNMSPVLDGFGTNVRPQLDIANLGRHVASVAKTAAPSRGQRQRQSFMSQLPRGRRDSAFQVDGDSHGFSRMSTMLTQQSSVADIYPPTHSGIQPSPSFPDRSVYQPQGIPPHPQNQPVQGPPLGQSYPHSSFRRPRSIKASSPHEAHAIVQGPHGYAQDMPQVTTNSWGVATHQGARLANQEPSGSTTIHNPVFSQHQPQSMQHSSGFQRSGSVRPNMSVRRPQQWGNVDFQPPPPDYD